MGKLEVHALHYPPLVRLAPVGDMGFLSGHQNHVTKKCSCDVVDKPNFDRPDWKSGARKSTVNNNLCKNDVQ